jgi:hypothetical protein
MTKTTADPAGVQAFGEKVMQGYTPEPQGGGEDTIQRFSPYAIDGGPDAIGDMEEYDHGDYVDYEDHLDTLRAQSARIAELEAALSTLFREVSGTFNAFDSDIRQAIGNTNVTCIKQRLDGARSALIPSNSPQNAQPRCLA